MFLENAMWWSWKYKIHAKRIQSNVTLSKRVRNFGWCFFLDWWWIALCSAGCLNTSFQTKQQPCSTELCSISSNWNSHGWAAVSEPKNHLTAAVGACLLLVICLRWENFTLTFRINLSGDLPERGTLTFRINPERVTLTFLPQSESQRALSGMCDQVPQPTSISENLTISHLSLTTLLLLLGSDL